MRKVSVIFLAITVLIILSYTNSQTTETSLFDFDTPISLRVEHFRKNEVDLSASYYITGTEYNGGAYQENSDLLPATYPDSNGQEIDSTVGSGAEITINPEKELGGGIYKIKVWDFDIDGNGMVDPGEWIDVNGNGVVDSGEWTDGGILYLRMYKRMTEALYKEIDYDYYIKPTMPPKVAYYPKSYDHVISGTAPALNTSLINFLAAISYYDTNHSGFYDDGEPIVNDLNGNGYYDGGDLPIVGAPPANVRLSRFKTLEKFYDANTNGTYDAGESIIRDYDNSSSYTDIYYGYKVIALHFKKCKACADYVGDVAYFEDEYLTITFNFAGIIKETKKEKLAECEGCFKADVTSKARLQLSVHKKFAMILDLFNMHTVEYAALPDHFVDTDMDGTPDEISNGRGLSYYYSLIDQNDVNITKTLDSERKIYQVAAFDPYYIIIKNSRELLLYETDYGEALKIPSSNPQAGVAKTEAEKWAYVDYTDTSGNFTTITLFRVFKIKTLQDGEVWAAKLVFTTRPRNGPPDLKTEEVYTAYYFTRDEYLKNDIIFPDCADFGVVVEKIDLENEKVWLKFLRKVDTQNINYDDIITFNQLGYSQINILYNRDIQIVFDEFDRLRARKCCEYPLKQLNRIPKYQKVLVDITTVTRNILNTASLRYEDLKGYATSKQYYEEQPQIVIEGQSSTESAEGTRVTAMDILKYGAVYDSVAGNNTIICAPGDLYCLAASRIAAKPTYFRLKYVDSNANGTYNPGETLIIDSNANSLYEATERVYYGTAPAPLTPLLPFGWNISMPTSTQDITYGDGYAFLDSYMTYTITSRNNSGITAIPDLIVTDEVPNNVTFVRAPNTVAGLLPNDTWGPLPAKCSAAPPPGEPAGCGIRYRINGAAPWTYVTNASDGDEGAYDVTARTMTLDYGQIGPLAAGARIDVQYVVWFDSLTDVPSLTGDNSLVGDVITNDEARITYTEGGISGQSLTADPITTRIGTATVTKIPNPPLALTPPGSVTYTLGFWQLSTTTQTTSFSPSEPLRVIDDIPGGTTYRAGSCAVTMGICDDTVLPTLTWLIPPPIVPPGSLGQVGTMTYVVDVPPAATGIIINSALLNYAPYYLGTTLLRNQHYSNDTQVTLIQPRPTVSAKDPDTACVSLTFEKNVPATAIPGSIITYTVTVTNSQPSDAPYSDVFNLTIVDPIPTGTTYVASTMTATINGNGVILTDAADVEIPDRYYGGFYDPVTKTVSLNLKNLPAGGYVKFTFNVTVGDVPINQYMVRAYIYDYFSEKKSDWLGMGEILGQNEVKITPDDTTKLMYDTIYTQVYENSNRKDRYPLKVFEKKIYDNAYYVDYNDFNETRKTAFFDIAKRSSPDLAVNMRTAVYDKITFAEISSDVRAEDEFILYATITNKGNGIAHDTEYVIDASAFSPQNITWIHDTVNSYPLQQPPLDIYGDERQTLMFLMEAPSVAHETTFPVKLKLKWKDDMGQLYTGEKVMFINVKHESRGQIEIVKHIVEGKNKTVSEETNAESVSLRVGERRTIHVYLRNTSDKKISNIKYVEVPPKGISIVEGSREWNGTLNAGQSADFIFKVEATQAGVYQLQARAFYEENGQTFDATSNAIEISVVGEKGPTVEKDTDEATIEKEGIINVVIKVSNDTKKSFKNIQVIEVIPKGFTVDEILTKGFTKKDELLSYQIDELQPSKYILLKYTLKAGPNPGIFTFLGTRALYEDSSKVKQEITSTDTELTILEESTPSLTIDMETQEREPFSSQEENVTMMVKLTNGGGIEARDVKFTLPIPQTTQFVDASGTPVKTDGGLAYKIDYINPGDTYVVKYTFKAMHTTEDRTLKIDMEAKYTDEFKREYSTKKDTTLTIEAKKPVVKISRVFDKNILKINYTFIANTTLTNEGDSSATVNFKDEFPEGFKVMTGQNSWSGTLKPGDTLTLTYEIMANRVGIFQLSTTAKAAFKATSGTEYTATLAEDDAQKLTVMGILVSKTVDRSKVFIDEITVVTVTIQNIYKEKASAIHVTDTIPQGTELVEGALEWSIENLEPDEKTVYTYSLKFTQEAEITLPSVLASFKDVYGDMHETLSEKALVNVTYPEGKKPTPPPESTVPPTTRPPTRIFKLEFIWIIIIVGIILVAGMVAILFIEQRRTAREEEKERIEQLTPEQLRAELWRRGAEERKELPTERKRPPREGLPPKAFRGEEEVEEKKPSFLDRILGRKPEASEEEEVRAPPILKEEEKEAPRAIVERMEAERIKKERAREITGVTDIREVMEGREEEMSDLERLIYGERPPKEEVKEKGPAPRDILKEREEKKEAPPARPVQKEEEYVVPSIIEKFRKKEEAEEPKSLRELIEERGAEPEKRDIKEIKRPSYLERILAKEKEEVPKPIEEEKPRRRLEDILKRAPVEKKPKTEEEKEEKKEEEEDELPDPKDLLKKNGNGKNGEKK